MQRIDAVRFSVGPFVRHRNCRLRPIRLLQILAVQWTVPHCLVRELYTPLLLLLLPFVGSWIQGHGAAPLRTRASAIFVILESTVIRRRRLAPLCPSITGPRSGVTGRSPSRWLRLLLRSTIPSLGSWMFLVRFGLSWPAFPRTLWLSFLASSFSFSLLFLLSLLCAASDRQRRFGFSASQVSTLPVPFTFPLPPSAASMALSLFPVFRSTSSLLALSSSTVTRTFRTTWYVYDSSPSVVSTG